MSPNASLDAEITSAGVSATFEGTISSSEYEVFFKAEAGGADALRRYLGCWILSVLPSKVIAEVVDSLCETYRYYSDERVPLVSFGRKAKGKIISKSMRPGSVISE